MVGEFACVESGLESLLGESGVDSAVVRGRIAG